ncbi:MAG: hypothetical protein H6721_22865 [Sandaracinus sp.]|nr:hypothetical protein [Myxococcales bacterium]MCB9604130.1 hypothetical protein [Sandaracinus sp.]MCB9615096.1 hypothetical protein [Sandaracinus sp.]MCB9634976.1 hypothetical protein [Sandaracinus sp.]
MRLALSLLSLLLGMRPCGGDDPPPDGGVPMEDAGSDAGERDAGQDAGRDEDAGSEDAGVDARCAIVDASPRTFPVETAATLRLDLACEGEGPTTFAARFEGAALPTGAATPNEDGTWRVTLSLPATSTPGVRALELSGEVNETYPVRHHCVACVEGAVEGELSGLPEGSLVERVLEHRLDSGVVHVAIVERADGTREARILDLAGARFGEAVAMSSDGRVALEGTTSAALVIASLDASSQLQLVRHPIVGTTFGRTISLEKAVDPLEAVLEVTPENRAAARGVGTLSLTARGELLHDVENVNVGASRRFASLGEWTAGASFARFAVVPRPGVIGVPQTDEVALLVLTGDVATGRYVLQAMTLPSVGEPVELARLEWTGRTRDVSWENAMPTGFLAEPVDVDGDGDLDVTGAVAFGADVEAFVLRAEGDTFAASSTPLPKLPLRVAYPDDGARFVRPPTSTAVAGGIAVFVITARAAFGKGTFATHVPMEMELRVGEGAGWNAFDATAQEGSEARVAFGAPGGSVQWIVQDSRVAAPRRSAAPATSTWATIERANDHGGLWNFHVWTDSAARVPVVSVVATTSVPRTETDLVAGARLPLGANEILLEVEELTPEVVYVRRGEGTLSSEGALSASREGFGEEAYVMAFPDVAGMRAMGGGQVGVIVTGPDGAELRIGRVEVDVERRVTLVDEVVLGGAPSAESLGLSAWPEGLLPATMPTRVFLHALPLARETTDAPAPTGTTDDVIALVARDTGTACPLALVLYPGADLTAAPVVLSTSDDPRCAGLEVPVSAMRGLPTRSVTNVRSAHETVSWLPPGAEPVEVVVSVWARQPTVASPDTVRAFELGRGSVGPGRGGRGSSVRFELPAVGDVDGDGLDDVWIDTRFEGTMRPTLRRGGGTTGVTRDAELVPPERIRRRTKGGFVVDIDGIGDR